MSTLPKSKVTPKTLYISLIIFIVAVFLEQWVNYPRQGGLAAIMMISLLCGAITLSNLLFLISFKSKMSQLFLLIVLALLIVLSIPIIKISNSLGIAISGGTLVMVSWGLIIYMLRVGYKDFVNKE